MATFSRHPGRHQGANRSRHMPGLRRGRMLWFVQNVRVNLPYRQHNTERLKSEKEDSRVRSYYIRARSAASRGCASPHPSALYGGSTSNLNSNLGVLWTPKGWVPGVHSVLGYLFLSRRRSGGVLASPSNLLRMRCDHVTVS